MSEAPILSPQQVTFYETFGYLVLPGLFANDIAEITAGFDAIFADEATERIDLDFPLHRNEPRAMVPGFIDRHPALAGLAQDPRIVSVVRALLGDETEYAESDGNLYSCDSEWHCDVYGSPLDVRHTKLAFYLDPLRRDSGAVRLIPGTNHWDGSYANTLRRDFARFGEIPSIYGVDGPDIPSVSLDSDPGDLLLWDFRTIHASYGGNAHRRLFTLNFRQRTPARQPVGAPER